MCLGRHPFKIVPVIYLRSGILERRCLPEQTDFNLFPFHCLLLCGDSLSADGINCLDDKLWIFECVQQGQVEKKEETATVKHDFTL